MAFSGSTEYDETARVAEMYLDKTRQAISGSEEVFLVRWNLLSTRSQRLFINPRKGDYKQEPTGKPRGKNLVASILLDGVLLADIEIIRRRY
jgi:hypothetical protein